MPSSVSNRCLWEGLCDHITAPTLREVLPPGDFDILCFSPVLSLHRFYLADFSLSSKFLVYLMIICPASLYLTLHFPSLPLSLSSVSGSSFHRLFDEPSAPSWSSQFGLFPELNLSGSKLETTGYLKSSGPDSWRSRLSIQGRESLGSSLGTLVPWYLVFTRSPLASLRAHFPHRRGLFTEGSVLYKASLILNEHCLLRLAWSDQEASSTISSAVPFQHAT